MVNFRASNTGVREARWAGWTVGKNKRPGENRVLENNMATKRPADSASPASTPDAPAPEVKVNPFAAIIAKKKECTKKYAVHFENLIEAVNAGHTCNIAISTSSLDWATLTSASSSREAKFQALSRLALPMHREAMQGLYSADAVQAFVETAGSIINSVENAATIPVEADASAAWVRRLVATTKANGTTISL